PPNRNNTTRLRMGTHALQPSSPSFAKTRDNAHEIHTYRIPKTMTAVRTEMRTMVVMSSEDTLAGSFGSVTERRLTIPCTLPFDRLRERTTGSGSERQRPPRDAGAFVHCYLVVGAWLKVVRAEAVE